MVTLTKYYSSWIEHENIPQFLIAIFQARVLLFMLDYNRNALLSAF